ncbi:MAG: NADH-quinone oxidoreductase subunit J [Dehalococcoidales bacterium]|nr:NADH-quinone oxidoreductase subunit J [Dehalococcoidales bacterium]
MGLTIAFWAFGTVALLSALGVVLLRNVFRAALSLVLCFLCIAGLYVTLSADFLAAAQILVYVGAISVLIILAVMMTRNVPQGSPGNRLKIPALLVAAVFLGVMAVAMIYTPWQVAATAPAAPTTAPLAGRLFGDRGFVLAVEIGAVLILSAVIGAIAIAREK